MEKKQIITANAPSPAGPYSQGIAVDRFVFVAGQRPADPKTGEIAEGIAAQTRQVIENLASVLEAAGSSLEDVVRSTVYLSDIKYFAEMNAVYEKLMPKPYPARTTIGTQLRGILVEIDVIAIKKD
ncbi:MAG: Rid family detoxifying hydrolase [Eubacteriales bacterium]|nr:Rid family detoxifying hydrolase [Eubacteriales bacterium]